MKTCPTCRESYPNNYQVCPADGSPLKEGGLWTEGSIIRDKYEILAKVGQGGMGSVYKARHTSFNELRALKVIAPELLADELFVKRFKHEAVITRRLQHVNAVRVDDIDTAEDGRPFIVMEFIEGKSLKKLIREEGPLPVGRVLSIIKQVAAALDAASMLGMVHRDIKPDNIALIDTPDGERVKVLDFGIAKIKEAKMGDAAGMTLTGAGVVIGTPQYMSPEQAMGKRGDELDGRADLYSLGVVMYQMLTADLPFKADTTMEMLLAHMQKPPAPIQVAHAELQVPESVAALTMRLLEKNRDMRPASARALIQEIENAEKELASPVTTRIVRPEDLVRTGEVRRTVGNRGATGVTTSTSRTSTPPPGHVGPSKPQPVPDFWPEKPPPQHVEPPPPQPPESRWGMWAALIVLLIGIGGGAAYIALHTDKRSSTNPPSPSPSPSLGVVTATLTSEPTAVHKGQPVTLHWSSQNATGLDLEPNVGRVDAKGSTTVYPDETTTYTLTAVGPGGQQSPSTLVTVTERGSPAPPPAPVATLSAEPTTIEKGQSAKLRWTSRNASSLILEPGVGEVDAQGATTVTPERTTTYTLVARGPGGTLKPTASVTVNAPKVDTRQVNGQITLGEFHLKRGEYDEAIAAYQKGLEYDPSNAELHKLLDQAISTCKKENAVLNEGLKCGGP
jgi:serine/threonine-protein kinase